MEQIDTDLNLHEKSHIHSVKFSISLITNNPFLSVISVFYQHPYSIFQI